MTVVRFFYVIIMAGITVLISNYLFDESVPFWGVVILFFVLDLNFAVIIEKKKDF